MFWILVYILKRNYLETPINYNQVSLTINFDCNVTEKEIENDKKNGNVSGTFEMMSLRDAQIELSDSKYVILTLHWVTGYEQVLLEVFEMSQWSVMFMYKHSFEVFVQMQLISWIDAMVKFLNNYVNKA